MKSRKELATEYAYDILSKSKCDICGGDFAYRFIKDKDTGEKKCICTACHMKMTFANGFVKYNSIKEEKDDSKDTGKQNT